MFLLKTIYMRRVMKSQFWSQEQVRKFQLESLQGLLDHARRSVPFYTKKLASIGPVESLADLRKLPIISREEYLNAGTDIYSRDLKYYKKDDLRERGTSGSLTGASFRIKYDDRAWDYLEAIYARSFFNQGYNPLFKMAYYWHEPLKPKFHNAFGLFRRHYIPCTLPIKRQMLELTSHRFKFIHYFSSPLYYISRIISKRDAAKIRPKAIFTHAEILSQTMKQRIERTFQTKVYDQYGTTEFVRMAWTCPICGEYHVDDDSIILEVLDSQGDPVKPGEVGRVVVTGLVNYLLPLIRYEMGDYAIVSKEKPKCRRGLQLLTEIVGRDKDYILNEKKELVPPRAVIDVLDPISGLDIFQVIQQESGDIDVLFKSSMHGVKNEIVARLKGLLGESVKVNPKRQEPKISSRGKLRLVYRT